ncbi:MAG: delta-60 repeat domain-containing protein [Cytophagaceae bacterium]
MAAGDFNSFNNVSYSKIVQLNTNGSVDENFSAETFDAANFLTALQDDGKILIRGNFMGSKQ